MSLSKITIIAKSRTFFTLNLIGSNSNCTFMSTILQTAKTPCSAKTVLKCQDFFAISEKEVDKECNVKYGCVQIPRANGFHDIPQTHDDAFSLFFPKLKSFTKQFCFGNNLEKRKILLSRIYSKKEPYD